MGNSVSVVSLMENLVSVVPLIGNPVVSSIGDSVVSSMINGNILVKAAVVDLTIQWIGCGGTWLSKSEKFYDLFGTSTFLYLTWVTLIWSKRDGGSPLFPRQIAQNSCVTIWALRLGVFLFSRVLAAGQDKRFHKTKENPSILFTFWTMQGAWVWLSLLPTMIVNTKLTDTPLNYRDYIGYGLWATGFLIEAIADYQKERFRTDPENKEKFITTGLWGLCRHPNYLGEMILWSGLFLPATNVFMGNEWFGGASSLFITYLLTNVSGIPILERYADTKWGALSEYQRYKADTAKLIPYIW